MHSASMEVVCRHLGTSSFHVFAEVCRNRDLDEDARSLSCTIGHGIVCILQSAPAGFPKVLRTPANVVSPRAIVPDYHV